MFHPYSISVEYYDNSILQVDPVVSGQCGKYQCKDAAAGSNAQSSNESSYQMNNNDHYLFMFAKVKS